MIALSGSSPSTMTAGIVLLTRARQLGFRLSISVVGDPGDLQRIRVPPWSRAGPRLMRRRP